MRLKKMARQIIKIMKVNSKYSEGIWRDIVTDYYLPIFNVGLE